MTGPSSRSAPYPHWILLIGCLVVTAVCSLERSNEPPAPAAPAPSVRTVAAAEKRVPRLRTVTGVLTANRTSTVAAGVTGKVLSASAERGQWVARGAVLARVEARGGVVRAPFAGLVVDTFVSEGELVGPETRVARIADLDTVRVEVGVPDQALAPLLEAGETELSFVALPGARYHATVHYIGPARRRTGRDLLVEAVLPNPDHRLLPGMLASAQVPVGAERGVVVPATAVRQQGRRARLFVVRNREVQERLVETGGTRGDEVVIRRGLEAGEQVVADPSGDLRDGARVQLAAAPSPSGPQVR